MKQVLLAKLKLAPTTEHQNLLWDIPLASQDVLNYASQAAWFQRGQLSSLSSEYTSLIKRAALICHSFLGTPKLVAYLTQETGQVIHLTPRNRTIPEKIGRDFLYNFFNEAYEVDEVAIRVK